MSNYTFTCDAFFQSHIITTPSKIVTNLLHCTAHIEIFYHEEIKICLIKSSYLSNNTIANKIFNANTNNCLHEICYLNTCSNLMYVMMKFKFTCWVLCVKLNNFVILISFIHNFVVAWNLFLLLILNLILVVLSEKYFRFQNLLMTLHNVMEHPGCDRCKQKRKRHLTKSSK